MTCPPCPPPVIYAHAKNRDTTFTAQKLQWTARCRTVDNCSRPTRSWLAGRFIDFFDAYCATRQAVEQLAIRRYRHKIFLLCALRI